MRFAARHAFLPLLSVAVACAAESATEAKPLPKHSPFLPPAGATTTAGPTETLEFAGVSAQVGKKPDLAFYDKSAKKRYWITEGETKDGIAVLRYDARRQSAVVKVNGVEKVLVLRKGTGPVNAPAPVQAQHSGFNVPAAQVQPAPPASAPVMTMPATASAPAPAVAPGTPAPAKPEGPATPESQAKAETEARMLVSDLLEIGMAQRKAYEEAQRRAAEGNAAQPAATPTTPGTTPPATTQPEKRN